MPTAEVVVLPNSKNVHLAAEEAAKLSAKEAVVVPTISQQGALAAIVELDREAIGAATTPSVWPTCSIRSGSAGVAPAARDDVEGRFAVGEAVGFEDDEVVAWGEPADTLAETLGRLADGRRDRDDHRGRGSPPVSLDDLDLDLPNDDRARAAPRRPAELVLADRDAVRPILWHLGVSHYAEKVRWALASRVEHGGDDAPAHV